MITQSTLLKLSAVQNKTGVHLEKISTLEKNLLYGNTYLARRIHVVDAIGTQW